MAGPRARAGDARALAGAFLLVFAAYNGTQALETSLQKTVGSTALAALYLTNAASAPLAPYFLKAMFDNNAHRALYASTFAYVLFIAANAFPSAYTLVPTAALLGWAAAILWTAQALYVTAAAEEHAAAIGASAPATVARFNGIFWGVFMGTYVVGPALAFVALQGREDSGDSGWLFPAYTAIAVAGALVLAFVVRPLDSRLADAVDEEAEHRGSASLEDAAPQQAEVLETSRLIPEAPAATNASLASTWFATLASDACFVPLLLLNGALQAYMWGPFAASYVKPRIHEAQVGVVTAIFGLADMASASLAGHFAGASDAPGDGAEDCAETARAPEKRAAANPAYARACAFLAAAHVVFALAVGGVLTGVLARGAPGLYAAAAATGVADGIFNSQISTVLGILHSDEAARSSAFSVWKTAQGGAMGASFLLVPHLAAEVQLISVLALTAVSLGAFAIGAAAPRGGAA